jgi:flagellar hook assembly protein FlgD
VRLEIFDLAGRRVRSLASGVLPAGEVTREWDGRDDRGHGVRSGVYFVRLTTPARTFTTRLVSLE